MYVTNDVLTSQICERKIFSFFCSKSTLSNHFQIEFLILNLWIFRSNVSTQNQNIYFEIDNNNKCSIFRFVWNRNFSNICRRFDLLIWNQQQWQFFDFSFWKLRIKLSRSIESIKITSQMKIIILQIFVVVWYKKFRTTKLKFFLKIIRKISSNNNFTNDVTFSIDKITRFHKIKNVFFDFFHSRRIKNRQMMIFLIIFFKTRLLCSKRREKITSILIVNDIRDMLIFTTIIAIS